MSEMSIIVRGREDGDVELIGTIRDVVLANRVGKVIQVAFRDEAGHDCESVNVRFEGIKEGRAHFSLPVESINLIDDDLY